MKRREPIIDFITCGVIGFGLGVIVGTILARV